MYEKNCQLCNKKMFRKKKSEAQRPNWKFCSRSCKIIYYNKKRKISDKPEYISGNKKCLYCKNFFPYRKELKVKCLVLWLNKIYIPSILTEKQRNKKAEECGRRFRNKKLSIKRRKKARFNNLGKKSHFWKGGITKKGIKLRNSLMYKLWRKAVFQRDNFTCQKCGKKNTRLNPHHIKSWAEYPKLRFEITNGQTLCEECHKLTDNYSFKSSPFWVNDSKVVK